jgi:hypothetical protein
VVRQSTSGQTWGETRLKWPSGDRGFYVQPLHTVVDAWHVAPDVNHAHNSGHFIANDFVFSFDSNEGSHDVAEDDTATLARPFVGSVRLPRLSRKSRRLEPSSHPTAAHTQDGLQSPSLLLRLNSREVCIYRSSLDGASSLTVRIPWYGASGCSPAGSLCRRNTSVKRTNPSQGCTRVKYPDRPALETHDLLPTSYGVNRRWGFPEQPS